MEVATGKVTDACCERHTNAEFLALRKLVAKTYPRRKSHVVADNDATHSHPSVQAWLAENPRMSMHSTSTSGSWLNTVEIFFGIITRQATRRGTFDSVRDLKDAIRTFIDSWNDRCQPFIWTKDAETILANAKREGTPAATPGPLDALGLRRLASDGDDANSCAGLRQHCISTGALDGLST